MRHDHYQPNENQSYLLSMKTALVSLCYHKQTNKQKSQPQTSGVYNHQYLLLVVSKLAVVSLRSVPHCGTQMKESGTCFLHSRGQRCKRPCWNNHLYLKLQLRIIAALLLLKCHWPKQVTWPQNLLSIWLLQGAGLPPSQPWYHRLFVQHYTSTAWTASPGSCTALPMLAPIVQAASSTPGSCNDW